MNWKIAGGTCYGILVAAAWLVLTAPQSAYAQPGRKAKGPSADKLQKLLARHPDADANNDGSLTPDEVRAYMQAHPDLRKGHGPESDGRGKDGVKPGWEQRAQEMLAQHPEADTNADGKLSPEEARAFLKANPPDGLSERLMKEHPELDTDGSGKLEYDELLTVKGKPGEMIRERIRVRIIREHPEADTNGDGRLSNEELDAFRIVFQEKHRAELLQRYPTADKDKDGKLSDDELKALKEERDARRRAEILKRFPAADTDNNGKLSDDELKAFLAQNGDSAVSRAKLLEKFPQADTNGDGKLSDDEIKAFKEQHKGEKSAKAAPDAPPRPHREKGARHRKGDAAAN